MPPTHLYPPCCYSFCVSFPSLPQAGCQSININIHWIYTVHNRGASVKQSKVMCLTEPTSIYTYMYGHLNPISIAYGGGIVNFKAPNMALHTLPQHKKGQPFQYCESLGLKTQISAHRCTLVVVDITDSYMPEPSGCCLHAPQIGIEEWISG